MQIEKVKAVITALWLFLLSALFCFFFIAMIYLAIATLRFFPQVYGVLESAWLTIFTAWLLHLAFISLVYTMRFAVRGKNKISECWNSSSQIVPVTPIEADHRYQPQQQQPQSLRSRNNKVSRVMVVVTKFLCAVTSVYLGVWVMVMVINEVVNRLQQGGEEHGKVGMARFRMALMVIGAVFIFLLFVLVIPLGCIYGRKDCCGGKKSTSSSSPKEHDDEIVQASIQLQQQRSDGNP